MRWDVSPGRVRDEMVSGFLEDTHEMGCCFLEEVSWDGMILG